MSGDCVRTFANPLGEGDEDGGEEEAGQSPSSQKLIKHKSQTWDKLSSAHRRKRVRDYLNAVPQLSGLERDTIRQVAEALISVTFEDGEQIIEKGVRGTAFYLIKRGTVNFITDDGGGVSSTRGEGEYFGESSLRDEEYVTGATAIAQGSCECFRLSRDDFTHLLVDIQDKLAAEQSQQKVMRAQAALRSGYRGMLQQTEVHDGEFFAALKDEDLDGALWMEGQKDGGHFSEERIIPVKPTWRRLITYYWDGLVNNAQNKWLYLDFRGQIAYVQEKLSAIHHVFFEMDERRELHDVFMLDLEGSELDMAVERVSW